MKNSRRDGKRSDFLELPVKEARKRWQEVLDQYSDRKEPPLVGIFWYHDKEIFGDFCRLAKADLYVNTLGPHSGHYDFWPEVQRHHPELACEEYEYVPRGRVLFDLAAGQFILISSKTIIDNKTAVKAICRRCNIPSGQEVILKTDQHYENPQDLNLED